MQFGDYVQATVDNTDNTMRSRTQGCIALLPTGNLTGSVKMWCLATNATVTREKFKILPMPDLIVTHITSIAASEGFTPGIDPDVGPLDVGPHDKDMQLAAPLPDMMMIDGRDQAVQLADHYAMQGCMMMMLCKITTTDYQFIRVMSMLVLDQRTM